MNFCLIFLLVNHSAISQNISKDSLLIDLAKFHSTDTNRINLLIDVFKIELDENLDKAENTIDEALQISKTIKNYRKEGVLRVYKSMVYGKKTLYGEALSQGILAVNILDSVGSLNEKIFANSELNSYYRVTGDGKMALEISLKILDLTKDQKDSPTKAKYFFEVGNAYGTLEDYKNGEIYFQKALNLSEKIGFIPGVMASKSNILELYYRDNNFEKLEPLAKELESYYKESDNKAKLSKIYYFTAKAKTIQHKHSEAIILYEKALSGYQEIGNLNFIEKCSQELYLAYSIKQNFESSEKYKILFLNIQDSIESKDKKLLIEEVKTKYETDKYKQEKILASEKAIRSRNFSIASSFIALLILITSFLYIYQIKLKKRTEIAELKLSESENTLGLERKYRNAELKALKAQMNPHFLFNAFNSIQEFIIMNKKEVASEFLGKFADLMRLYLEQSRALIISLEDELKSLRLYLQLEKIRFDDTLEYNIELSSEVHQETIEIPPLIIQPFVENALKHGLLHKKNNRNLWISFTIEKEVLICKIKDNGIGRKQSALLNKNRVKMHRSFAISSIESRIELLNVNREKKITLFINDLYDEENTALGTEVVLSIPI